MHLRPSAIHLRLPSFSSVFGSYAMHINMLCVPGFSATHIKQAICIQFFCHTYQASLWCVFGFAHPALPCMSDLSNFERLFRSIASIDIMVDGNMFGLDDGGSLRNCVRACCAQICCTLWLSILAKPYRAVQTRIQLSSTISVSNEGCLATKSIAGREVLNLVIRA